jgi:hypothetical protein
LKKVRLPRTKTYDILCYEALFRWLLPQLRDNKILQEDFASFRAGYRGERNTDYVTSTYPHKFANIYQGIRLKVGPFHFQIDTLIVTPMFILILESKNMKGELEYNPKTRQLIQINGEHRKGQKNPVLQAETQKRHLATWLQQAGFPPIPIETIGISTNPSSILTYKDEGTNPSNFVLLESLPTMFDYLYQSYTRNIYDQTTLRKLNKSLLKGNTPYKPDLINQYKIKDRHLIKGIGCRECNYFPLKYKSRKWLCTNCGNVEPKAHEQKIFDYFLLFEPTINNRKCREILQIESPKVARRLLYSMNLEQSGNNFGRTYQGPTLDKFPQDSFLPIGQQSIFND